MKSAALERVRRFCFMKRKLIGAALLLSPVAMFFVMREVASWRPKKIAQIGSPTQIVRISSDGRLLAGAGEHGFQVFDIQTRTRLLRNDGKHGRILGLEFSPRNDELFVQTITATRDMTILGRIFRPSLNGTRGVAFESVKRAQDWEFLPPLSIGSEDDLRVGGIVWNRTNGKITARNRRIQELLYSEGHFSVDGHVARKCCYDRNGTWKTAWKEVDLQTGKTKFISFKGIRFFEDVKFSQSGRFVFFEQPDIQCAVVDGRTGREKWRFLTAGNVLGHFILSPDETQIAIFTGKSWEIRALQTGALLKKLPATGTFQTGAFSPDNSAIFWADEKGNLWRQRTR